MKPKVIAFYLPQFHPIPENDEWWGKGFTEWTNVGKAKPLFRGHYQPHVPADLGYYDLRVPEVREQQAELAREAGVSAFCYWHYWFGNGKRLLERPFNEVLASGKPDFPFCLAWANETWSGIWHGLSNKILIEQTYPGADDYEKHFYAVLPAFKDKRYITVEDKPLFVIYHPLEIPDCKAFIEIWQNLAIKNGLKGIYFVGCAFGPKSYQQMINLGFNGLEFGGLGESKRLVYTDLNYKSLLYNSKRFLYKFGIDWKYTLQGVFDYEDIIVKREEYQAKVIQANENLQEIIYPELMPNWDNSPRCGKNAIILQNSTPEKFRNHINNIFNLISKRPQENQIIFLKSWNEWAEGNYMEPDLKYGKGYINALREAINEYENV